MEKVLIEESNEIVMQVGNDNGNSEHDIMINGELIQQPNVYAKVRKLPNLEALKREVILKKIEENLIVTSEDPNGIFHVGTAALKSGNAPRNIDVSIDNNKITSDIVTVNTLAQIAGYAAKEYFEKHGNFGDIIKAKVDMATSLPVKYYNDENATKFTNKFLPKTHLMTVHVGAETARVEIEFPFVKTIPEGVTGAWALREAPDELFAEYNEKLGKENAEKEGNSKIELLNKDFFKKAKVLHVAIGEGTTEYPVTTGIEFDPNFIDGTYNGIGHAIDKALDEFKEFYGLSKFTRQDYSEVIKEKKHKYHQQAMEIVEPYIEEQAEDILRNIKSVIQKANNEIDIVCVYGGGSILMREALESNLKAFCDRAKIKLLYIPSKYAVTLEAEGLYNFTKSKVFSSLKSKYKK